MTTSARARVFHPEASEDPPSRQELEALANFRHALRRFLAFSEAAAAEVGLTMQWYQALLVVKTYRGGDHISVGELAEQLMIRDHSAAELVSRLAQAKLVRRVTDPADRRRSLIVMTPMGNRRLDRLAVVHLNKLRENKGAFLSLFDVETERRGAACRNDEGDGRPAAAIAPAPSRR
ncbi:MarR family winged helix-turn-helix transcriptional regulator [Methylocystis sp. S23]